MKNITALRWVLMVGSVLLFFCAPAISASREVKLDIAQKREFNTFFSIFSQADLQTFARGKLTNANAINFAVTNAAYSGKWKESKKPGVCEIAATHVSTSARYYLGYEVKTHRSVSFANYRNSKYYYLAGCYLTIFSQIDRLTDNGDGTLTAHVTEYGGMSPGWAGDEHGSMEAWKREATKAGTPDDVPRAYKRLQCLIKQVGKGSQVHYVLLEYKKTS